MLKPIYYVYEPTTGYTKFQHETQCAAENEAERLAVENPGKTFQVLCLICQCIKNDVTWDSIDKSDLPF